jgi:cell division protein FtsB
MRPAAVDLVGMKKTVAFAALYVTFAAGALATCLFGRAGVEGYRSLERYAGTLRRNITELEAANASLATRLDSLRTDADAVRVLSRDLGYTEPGEKRVVVSTYDPPRESYPVGYVVQAPPEVAVDRRIETLYLLPLFVLFVAFCIDGARTRRDD